MVFGTEVGVTAMEVVTSGDPTRLDLDDDLVTVRSRLATIAESTALEAVFVVDAADPSASPEVTVVAYGPDDAVVASELRRLDEDVRRLLVSEGAVAAWRQRLADAADGLEQLTAGDAEALGRLGIAGRPLLTELRAERRRSMNTETAAAPAGDVVDAIERLIVELRAAIRFGAAGMLEQTGNPLELAAHAVRDHGGWVDRIRLLLAAEEVWAIEWLAQLRGGSPNVDSVLAAYAEHRTETEDLASLLDEVVGQLPDVPEHLATRIVKRRSLRDADALHAVAEAFSSVVTATERPAAHASWDEAARALTALDRAATAIDDGGPSQSAEEAAALLGELFARQLPAARALVEDLRRQHPADGDERVVRTVKRQAVHRIARAARGDVADETVAEVVAELAMAIALLRKLEPRTSADFAALGESILARADKIAGLHAQAGTALPGAFASFARFAKEVQPYVAEFVFHKLGGFKPGQAGVRRDAYKFARSRVWRARHDPRVAETAGRGAADALLKAVDAGAPRLIVRHVDRSLRSVKR